MLHPAITEAIERGALLITPNQRIARAIRIEFAARQTAPVWTPPEVLPLEAWLASLWRQRIVAGVESRVLLNASQQHLLWREIVAADPEAQGLRSPDALADLASRAWSMVCQHNGVPRLREFAQSTDSRAFERWARAFERRISRAELITAAQLPAELLTRHDLTAQDLAFVDFDDHPPAIADLLAGLRRKGTQIEFIETRTDNVSMQLHRAADDRAELRAAAEWARHHLDARPQMRLAIVVPNLGERKRLIGRTVAPILSMASLPITAPESDPVYEFSLGRPLAELEMAITALDLLAWPRAPLAIERISTLLRSPWFAPQDGSAIATFDAFVLRKAHVLQPELSLESTLRLVERAENREALAELPLRLRRLNRIAQEMQIAVRPGQSEPLRQTFGKWSEAFRATLDAAGCTRHARSSSLAFQQHRAWESALDELATLDTVGALPQVEEAIASLKRILRSSIFAPQSSNAPVQIMGPLEVGGTQFDALWFIGADDLNWPPAVAASPLLPWQLQRSIGVPGADPARDKERAQRLTSRIAHSAAEIVFSFALQAEEGERRPSPLLSALNLTTAHFEMAAQHTPTGPLEIVADETTLPPLSHPEVRGGTELLKLQAACAFRAFAERRLFSATPDSPTAGLDPRESGTIVHTVMQQFWNEVQSLAGLRALSPDQAAEVLDRAIVHSMRTPGGSSWEAAYLSVQRQRLYRLLTPWLDIEASRSEFFVQPPEQKKTLTLGPLTLDLRIDRIDSTAAGDFIVDYKTGPATPSQWCGDRPDEPQLPLYAVLAKTENRQLAGVAFALLRPGDGLAMKGYAEDPLALGGAKASKMEAASLDEQVDKWRTTLTALAESFAAGDTRVLPKDYPKTCSHCGQRMLCRLNPDALIALDDEEGEAADV